ncbi:GHKL domain-containing protein [Patescibacteria group bacterium]|nr:GHKL domain-containing protein [Patescibacteria group bacterium]
MKDSIIILYNRISNYISRYVRFFYKTFLESRKIDLDDKRREFITNILILGSIILFIFINLVVIYYRLIISFQIDGYTGLSMLIYAGALVFLILLFVISRLGYYKFSAAILLGIYLAMIIYITSVVEVVFIFSLLGFVIVIVMAGILFNSKVSLIITTFSSSILLVIYYLHQNKIIPNNTVWRTSDVELKDVILLVLIFFIIYLVSWLSNREIEKNLDRAHRSEAALKQERDMLEVRVKERTEELRQAQLARMSQLYRFAEFGRLASGLFHDLMSPLTAISLNLESFSHDSKEQIKDTSKYLDQAMEATKRMDGFIAAIRKQLQSQEIQELFSVNEEISQVLQIVAHKAKKAHVNLVFENIEDDKLFGNPLKFNQIITNLVSNAIDSYENKKTVNNRQVEIRVIKNNESLTIKVQDWGSGISKENLPKIFDSFFTTKDINNGIGIGLSNTKNIIENHFHGIIGCESKEGEGSLFIIELPCRAEIIKQI